MVSQAETLIDRHLATLEASIAEDEDKPQGMVVKYTLHTVGPEDDRRLQISAAAKVSAQSGVEEIAVVMDGAQLALPGFRG
jgi:hypothetical protein